MNIADKVKKLLALAHDQRANPNEAATALRQAQKLMEEHSLTEASILAAECREEARKASHRKSVPNWLAMLANGVARAFGCQATLVTTLFRSEWRFLGVGARPTVCVYAFDCLLKQTEAARRVFLAGQRKSLKRQTKTARADHFCEGFVAVALRATHELTLSERDKAAMEAYHAEHKRNVKTGSGRSAKKANGAEDAFICGAVQGRNASLKNGVDGAQPIKAIAGKA